MKPTAWESLPLTIGLDAPTWASILDALDRSVSDREFDGMREACRQKISSQAVKPADYSKGRPNIDVPSVCGSWVKLLALIGRHAPLGTLARNGGAVIAAGVSAVAHRKTEVEE